MTVNKEMLNSFKKAYKSMNYNKESMYEVLDVYVKTFPKIYSGMKPHMPTIEIIKKHIDMAVSEVDKERQI